MQGENYYLDFQFHPYKTEDGKQSCGKSLGELKEPDFTHPHHNNKADFGVFHAVLDVVSSPVRASMDHFLANNYYNLFHLQVLLQTDLLHLS